jgi:two-component system CheB/CheR fusion protein
VLQTDPKLLERIVRTLLTNAVTFTASGKIVFGCRRSRGFARIQVIDTGCGIAADQLGLIFDEFYQVPQLGRRTAKGMGLGLAIADRLAKLLGLRLSVRSQPGRGSMFEVWVPIVETASKSAAADDPTVSGDGRLVVIIDDDPAILASLEIVLDIDGWTVITASSAEEAATLVRAAGLQPAVVVADYRLDGSATGYQAIDHLRRECRHPVPAVLLTGDTSPDRLREARANGCTLLHKPVRPQELHQALATALATA